MIGVVIVVGIVASIILVLRKRELPGTRSNPE